MRRIKLFGALLLGLLLIGNGDAQTRTDRENDGLLGPVRNVRTMVEETYQTDGTSLARMRAWEYLTIYDEKGNRTEESSFSGGVLNERTTYARDENDTVTTIRYKGDGTMVSKLIERFHADGRPLGGLHYDGHGVLLSKSEYTYGADGKFLEAAVHNADGSLVNKTIFKHDATGKQTGLEVYDSSGKLLRKQVETERDLTAIAYGSNGGETHEWTSAKSPATSEFDSHGNWTKKSEQMSEAWGSKPKAIVRVSRREISYF